MEAPVSDEQFVPWNVTLNT